MEQGKELLDIIIKIIYESDIQDFQGLVNQTKQFKNSRNFKEFLNFEHRTHGNHSIRLKNCERPHCVECLYSSPAQICPHDQHLTPYELSLVAFLVSQLNIINNVKVSSKKCRICSDSFNSESLLNRSCPCSICDYCLVSQYKLRKINCEYCGTKLKSKQLKKIGKNIKIDVERFDNCLGCGLVYEYSSLLNQVCLLCEQKINL